jgi:hypothetical protein
MFKRPVVKSVLDLHRNKFGINTIIIYSYTIAESDIRYLTVKDR